MERINRYVIYLFFFLPSFVLASGAGITYNGRLLDPSGNAVTSSNVQFRIQIRTPGNENCLMYEEIQTKDMTNSDGIFSITINDGTGSRTDSTGYALDQIFANRGSFTFTSGYCAVGTTYNTSPADGRKLQVYFNDGSFATGQWEPTPSMAINFIPMAIESQQVGGYKKEQLIKIADGVSTTGTELDSTKWTNLLALINGTSTAYTKPTDQVTQLYGATVPTPANGQSIRWNSALNSGTGGWENFTAGSASAVTSVSSANSDIAVANGGTTPQLTLNSGTGANQIVKLDGTAKLPAVDGSALTNVNASKVGGTTVSLASLTSGQVLKYNGTNWVNAADADTLGGLSCANGRVAYYTGGAWACLEVTSVNTVNTIVSRDASGVSNFGTVNAGTLKVNDGATGAISLITPVAVTSYSMRLPATSGSNGQVLTTDGGNPAQLSWSSGSSQWTTSSNDIYYNTGNVGIGTTTMNALDRLTVNDSTGADAIVKVKSSGNNAFLRLDGYTAFDWELATSGSNFALREYGNQGSTYIAAEGGLPNGSTTPIYIKSNGSVGIGTSSPSKKFDVQGGDIALGSYGQIGSGNGWGCTGCANSNSITVYNGGTGSMDFNANVVGASSGLNFNLGGSTKLRVHSDGNVGVGTSSPSSVLHVLGANATGSGNATNVLDVLGGTGGPSGGNGASISLVAGASTPYQVGNGGSVTISAGSSSTAPGSVSISSGGQTSGGLPSNITLSKTAGNNGGVVTLSGGNGGNGSGNGGSVSLVGGNGDSAVSTTGGAVNLTGGTGNGAAGVGGNVVINGGSKSGSGTDGNILLASSRGYVGIGTSTPASTLDIVGTAGVKYTRSGASSYITLSDYGGSQPGIYLSGADSSVTTFMHSRGPFKLYSGGADQGSAAAKILLYGNNSGQVGVGTAAPDQLFSVNGDASKVGGGSWQTFSDARLKTVNGDFTRGLEEVLKLQPISYHYNDRNPAGVPNNGDHIGFVAQDVEKVIPEAISKSKKGYLMVNNDPIIWTMFNAIKELYHKMVGQDSALEEVKNENEELKGRLKQLESQNQLIRSYLCEKDPKASICQ